MKFIVAITLMAFGANAFTVQPFNGRASTSLNLYGEPRPVEIIPSVLPADWANMGGEVKRLEEAGVDRIQFDVMDGNFVPNLTFGPEMIAACRKYTTVPFETQLMVSQYNCETMLDQYTEATKGPDGEPGVVIAHVEGNNHLHRVLTKIREAGGSPSVALNPHTPAEMIENILDLVDHVLVMTVNPGFGGQAYIPTMVDKIKKIRKWGVDRGLDFDIEVDGGVKVSSTNDDLTEIFHYFLDADTFPTFLTSLYACRLTGPSLNALMLVRTALSLGLVCLRTMISLWDAKNFVLLPKLHRRDRFSQKVKLSLGWKSRNHLSKF